ncbi:hypothetical protein QCA50_008649 [Cerrena zonata]|uniref:Uncharacterized protein n=1 Tax=Cerrena zonata TaxID=2478898 RepID=A0AAW0GAB4_9APHY
MIQSGKLAGGILTHEGMALSQPVQLTQGPRREYLLNMMESAQPDGITRNA